MKSHVLLALVIIAPDPVNAFTLRKNLYPPPHISTSPAAFTSPENDRSRCVSSISNTLTGQRNSRMGTKRTRLHAEKDSGKMTTLHLTGKEILQSDPVPLRSSLKSFLEQDEIKTMLLAGNSGGDEPPQALSKSVSISYKDEWTKQARIVGAQDPDPENGDVVCKVNTSGLKLPGIVVKSVAFIGTKVITDTGDDSALPIYEFVFIRDQRFAEGNKFIVWVFDKLTGKKSDDEEEPKILSLSRFYAKTLQNANNEPSVVFTIDAFLDIAVEFPSTLLKILPVSKEKAEEQGSTAIAKTLTNDTGAAVRKIASSYGLFSEKKVVQQ